MTDKLITTLKSVQLDKHYLVKKFLSEIKNNDVIVWEGPYSPLCLLFCWNNKEFYDSTYDSPASPALEVISGRNGLLAFNNTYYVNYAREIFARYWKEPDTFTKRNSRCESLRIDIENLYSKIQKEDLGKISEEKLISWGKEMNLLLGELEVLSIFVETFDKNVVLAVIGLENQELVDSVWEKATHPIFESFEIRRLKILLERLGDSFEPAVVKHLQFIYTDYFNSKDFIETERLLKESFSTPEKLLKNKEDVTNFYKESSPKKKKYDEWLESLSAKEKMLVQYVQAVMEIRDWRKDPIAQAQTVLGNICREMLSRSDIDQTLAPYLLPQELSLGTNWMIENKDQITKRQMGMVAFRGVDGAYEISLDDISAAADDVSSLVLKQDRPENEIRGQIGSKGLVRGIAKIIKDASFADNFNKGDILITGMTRPEFVPLMKKAGGIVTDEGGITCHAAIVSRELNIPCIIGTKVATHLIKDGNMIEVDADRGIVKIIR